MFVAAARDYGLRPAQPRGARPEFQRHLAALDTANWDLEAHAAEPGPVPSLGALLAVPPGPGVVVGGAIPYLPAALEQRRNENRKQRWTADPERKCFMPGVPRANYLPYPFQIVQGTRHDPDDVRVRRRGAHVYMTDPGPAPDYSWMGWNVGRWDGNTLVVDVTAQRDDTWLDRSGNYHSKDLHVVERYTLRSPDVLHVRSDDRGPEGVLAAVDDSHAAVSRHVADNAQLMDFKCIPFVEDRVVRRDRAMNRAASTSELTWLTSNSLASIDPLVGVAVAALLAASGALAQHDAPRRRRRRSSRAAGLDRAAARERPTGHPRHLDEQDRSRRSSGPTELGDKEFFTREEAEAFVQRTLHERGNRDNRTERRHDVLNAYNEFWWDSGTKLLPTMRTSIVTDPPNGRIPPLTPQRRAALDAQRDGAARRAARNRAARSPTAAQMAPADEPQALDLMTRCISFGTAMPMLPTRVQQQLPDRADGRHGRPSITEMVHQVRRIPTSGSRRCRRTSSQWFGDPRGRWDGDTLVVETTNFKGEFFGRMAAADENLRVVERFTRVGTRLLLYEFTVDDPTAWTAPWSGEIPLTRTDGLLYEYACHEGNRGMENILRAARKEIGDAKAR